MTIWHLALASDWMRAQQLGTYGVSTRGATIADVGFLHASTDRAQTDAVAARYYTDVTEPLFLLEIDEALLPTYGLLVRREPADPRGTAAAGGEAVGPELFPHVYGGPLPVGVVVAATPYVVPTPG